MKTNFSKASEGVGLSPIKPIITNGGGSSCICAFGPGV